MKGKFTTALRTYAPLFSLITLTTFTLSAVAETNIDSPSHMNFVVNDAPYIDHEVSIISPTPNDSLTFPINAHGVATANSGIHEVLVSIIDKGTQQWWNGSSWGSSWKLNPAQTTSVSATEVAWNYSFAPGTVIGSGRYRINVRARKNTPQTLSDAASVVFQAVAPDTLDPAGCLPLTDQQLIDYGYEPVRAHGAMGDGQTLDTAAIKEAISVANQYRRVVYLHPGNYLVDETLEFKQDIYQTLHNDDVTRFGQMLLGSYCGQSRPTITLKNAVANDPAVDPADEPFPVVLFWRDKRAATGPDDSHGSRDWNQVIRNVNINLGSQNRNAVGIRHAGAEGSSAQEVSIDAHGGFAGLYNLNSSGGYTYNVEVTGGQYGIYQPENRGGSTLVVGLKLSDQVTSPIALGGYTPVGIVGFDIRHQNGKVIRVIGNAAEKLAGWDDTAGNIYLVDGKIHITTVGDDPILVNTNRSLYLKNVFLKGRETIVEHEATGGALRSAIPSVWEGIEEYAYSGENYTLYGEYGMLVNGQKYDGVYYNRMTYPGTSDIVINNPGVPPDDLLQRHTYDVGLCNVEASDNVFVTDNNYGANPNDAIDDTASIQAAINAAQQGSNRVFLPASQADSVSGALLGSYIISGTLQLAEQTRLCGVTRYSTILDAQGWTAPAANSAVIETVNDTDAQTSIADFKIEIPIASGYSPNGDSPYYNPHVYGINWRAGQQSLYRDVYVQRRWGDFGDGRAIVIQGAGGGRWFGITLNGGYLPNDNKFTDSLENLKMSPLARNLLITGTTQPLTFYPFHCQHMTQPKGALCEINQAANVTLFGIKSEIGSIPEKMTALIEEDSNGGLIPVLMRITDSANISLIGHEGIAQTAIDQGLIEIINSTNVTVAAMGRRGSGIYAPQPDMLAETLDKWYFVLDDNTPGINGLKAQGYISLYKR